jgi:hypothetical protein
MNKYARHYNVPANGLYKDNEVARSGVSANYVRRDAWCCAGEFFHAVLGNSRRCMFRFSYVCCAVDMFQANLGYVFRYAIHLRQTFVQWMLYFKLTLQNIFVHHIPFYISCCWGSCSFVVVYPGGKFNRNVHCIIFNFYVCSAILTDNMTFFSCGNFVTMR